MLKSYRSAATLVVVLSVPIGIGPVLFPDANYWGFLAGGAVCMKHRAGGSGGERMGRDHSSSFGG